MKKLLLIALSTFAMTANAWEPTFYAGSNLATSQFEPSGFDSNFTLTALEFVGGAILAPHISVEARFGLALGEEQESLEIYPVYLTQEVTVLVPGTNGQPDSETTVTERVQDELGNDTIIGWSMDEASLKTNYYASIYLRPFISNEKATLYALLGYSNFDYELSLPNGARLEDGSSLANGTIVMDGSEGGISTGVGVSFTMSESVELTAEWKKIINAEDFSVTGGTIGFIYKF